MNSKDTTKEVRAALREILGLTLRQSWNVFATRMFYFGEANSQTSPGGPEYTLGIECPWRIRRRDLIVVGSEDHNEEAEGNTDPSWEPGMPGSLQNQKLAELLGESKKGDVITTTRPGFVVESVEPDGCGGIRIELGQDYVLEVFPASARSMEWIFMRPGQPSFVLMNGVVNKTKTKNKKRIGTERGDSRPKSRAPRSVRSAAAEVIRKERRERESEIRKTTKGRGAVPGAHRR